MGTFLCFALLTSIAPQALADPGRTDTDASRVRIAIGECSDGTDQSVPGLTDTLERSLRKSLADQRGVQVVGLGSGEPERVVSARIARATSSRKGRPAEVEVVAESTDAATQRIAYRTTIRAEGTGRPGEDRVALVHRAVEAAAGQVAAHQCF